MLESGLGISLTITCAQKGPFHVKLTKELFIAWGFLIAALFSALIVFRLSKFRPPKWFALYLFALYTVFMTMNILVEKKII